MPPFCLANNQLKRAVLAPPTCSLPVGLGAKRARTFLLINLAISLFPRQPFFLWWYPHDQLAPHPNLRETSYPVKEKRLNTK
ncbi:hypothetical protein CEE35_05015 [Candidatus Aerophobetes bacterium Ae_b3b]|nr:MAG: hypothetical protein CEE35_05015 [Candidatus Aerophobetes bacterium Ae_b3b]